MTTTNTTEIESLRTFATAHGEIEFAHLCTSAINGEEWAAVRIQPAMDALHCVLFDEHEDEVVSIMASTDTTRPDSTVPRSLSAPV